MAKSFRRINLLAAIILLLFDVFLWYYKWNIVTEMVQGRPLRQLPVSKLLLPLIVLVLGFFLLIKKTSNGKKDVS